MRRLIVLATVLLLARGAAAEPEAEKLFEEGRALLDAGRFEEACSKFESSMAKDPRQVGVLMNLAVCNERVGKLATALSLYREALARATESDLRGAKALAQKEIDKLLTRVPVLELARDVPPLPGEKIVIDDKVIAPDTTELPVDPGSHVVTVTAPGRLPYEIRVELRGTDRKRILVPELAKPQDKIVERHSSSQRLLGKVFVFGGSAVVVAAIGLAYYADTRYESAFEGSMPHCGRYPNLSDRPVCDVIGQASTERARRLGTIGTIAGVSGLAIALTGAVLWATSPSETARTRMVPTASDTGAGVLVQGSF